MSQCGQINQGGLYIHYHNIAIDCFEYREMTSDVIEEYFVQIQLRFCLMETSCEQKDEFPPSINVRANNKMVTLPVRFHIATLRGDTHL